MKYLLMIFFAFIALTGCTRKQQDFAQVEKGMSKNEVISLAGEPDKKNNLQVAELWVYTQADRTVVFRNDTVYNIITSSEARTDSIEMSLKKAGQNIKEGAKETGSKVKQGAKKLGSEIDSLKDSLKK